ncbi:MAG: hypothetical protein KC503_22060 [Myxococcales bacterium]|nr:hypothetical protein [Myxococcales bacterium]
MNRTKATIVAAALMAFGCGQPPAHTTSGTAGAVAAREGDRLEVRRDGDHVTVRVRPPSAALARTDELHLVAGVTFREHDRQRGLATVLVGFRRVGEAFRFASCRTITFHAAGKLVGQTLLRREAQIGGKRVHELVFALLPAAAARRLASAERISVGLCGERFPISDAEHRQLRRFVARLADLRSGSLPAVVTQR